MGMPSIETIKAKRYINGSITDACYQVNRQNGEYLYFSDNRKFRKSLKNNQYEVMNENGAWVTTNDIWDASSSSFDTNGATAVSENADVESAVLWALQTADSEAHGYDQPTRDGGTDYDCSSFVSTAFRQAGFSIPTPSPSTYTMRSAFASAGFTWLAGAGYDFQNLHRGDILLYEGDVNLGTGHTALYVGSGLIVEACLNEFGGVAGGQPGDQGNEIDCHAWWDSSWDGVLRYEG